MRKTLGVCLFVLLLTGSAVAGEIPNDAPAPTSTVQGSADAPTVGGVMGNDAPDSLTQTALDLFALLRSLL